jgi:hypothetical protein
MFCLCEFNSGYGFTIIGHQQISFFHSFIVCLKNDEFLVCPLTQPFSHVGLNTFRVTFTQQDFIELRLLEFLTWVFCK